MRRALIVLITCAAALPALAQDAAEDWDLTVDPARELTLASLDFGGNALALRCQAGVLDLLLTGVTPSTGESRTVRVTAGGIAGEAQTWLTQPGSPVLSASEPDRLARQLRAGGELDLRIEPAVAGERAQRFRLPAPPSANAVDRTLSACGASLADEWDTRPRAGGGVTWARQVLPAYPEAAAARNIPMASARVACIVPANGRSRSAGFCTRRRKALVSGAAPLRPREVRVWPSRQATPATSARSPSSRCGSGCRKASRQG